MLDWELAAKLATEYGLGILLAVMLGALFVLVIKRLLKSQETSAQVYGKIIEEQRLLIKEFTKETYKIINYLIKRLDCKKGPPNEKK